MQKRVSTLTCVLMLCMFLSPITARAATNRESEARDVALTIEMLEGTDDASALGEEILKSVLEMDDETIAEMKKMTPDMAPDIEATIEAAVLFANMAARTCRHFTTEVVEKFSVTDPRLKAALLVCLNEMTIVYDMRGEKYRRLADAFKKSGSRSIDKSRDGVIEQHLVKAATAFNQAKALHGRTR